MLNHFARRSGPAVALLVLLGACNGVISDTAHESGGSVRPRNLDRDGDGIPDVMVPAAAGMRRLSNEQYANAVHDLLGDGIEVPAELEPDTAVNGFIAVGSSRTTISPRGVEQYETAAFSIAQQAVADTAGRGALVPCAGSGSDAACLRSFVTDFGRRAWRRPLTADEIDRYAAIAVDAATTLGDFWAGVEFAIAGLLQSPSFLFRVELGEPMSGGRRYTEWEMATRLAFFLWNTTPDDALLAAAERGELTTDAGLRAQAERLASDPRARTSVRTFFDELLDLVAMDELTKDTTIYPQMTATTGASMREGALKTFEHLVFEADADYRSFFDTRITFVNADLAPIYGVDAPAGGGFEQVMLPADGMRAGLLGQAAVLARHSYPTRSSPTLRGKFVRQVLMCQGIPAPPDDVGELPEPSPDARTMRERLAIHRENPSCASCHDLMDPIGLGLENFDGIGAFRETENEVTIDPSGQLDGMPFADAAELGAVLRDNPLVGQCLVRNMYRFATGHIETDGEEVVLRELIGSFEDDYRIRGLLVDIVMSDGFRFAGEPQ